MKFDSVRKRTAFPLVMLAAVWLGLSALSICYVHHWKNRLGSAMHVTLVFNALLLCLLPFMVLPSRLLLRRTVRAAFAFVLGTTHFFVLLFYVAMLGGRKAWGMMATWALVRVYLRQVPALFHQFGEAIAIPCLGLVLIWVLMLTLYYVVGGYVLSGLQALRANPTDRTQSVWRSPLACTAGWLCLFVVVYVSTVGKWRERELVHWAFLYRGVLTNVPEEMIDYGGKAPQRTWITYAKSGHAPIPRHLILITVDALRSDQMGVYGSSFDDSPFLSSMVQQRKIQRIDSAYSVCTVSYCGILGTLSSSYRYQINRWIRTLPSVLPPMGYKSRLLLSGDHTHFYGLRHFYGDQVEEYLDGSDAPNGFTNDDIVILPWLKAIPWESDGPTFVQIHLMSVHNLGVRQPQFKRWQPSEYTTAGLLAGHSIYEMYRNNYRNGILEADDTIRNIFQLLEEKHVLESSLVVITADHGEYLGEWKRMGHARDPYEPVVRIPLLIYDPAGTVYPKRALTSQVDIAPTLLYAIGAPIPAEWSGIPLQLSTTRNVICVGSPEATGVVVQMGEKRYKYLEDNKTHKEQVFDLGSQRGEMENLASQQPALTAQLRAMYEKLRATAGPGPIQ